MNAAASRCTSFALGSVKTKECLMYKRWYILCSTVVCFIALSASAISFDDARHLLNRTGFGATPEDIEKLTALTHLYLVSLCD